MTNYSIDRPPKSNSDNPPVLATARGILVGVLCGACLWLGAAALIAGSVYLF
jgi:hypothetical protein